MINLRPVEYIADKQRNRGGVIRFLYLLRVASSVNQNKLLRYVFHLFLLTFKKKYGLEISPETRIGKGLYIGHAFNITINPKAVIGDNCNLHKGVTIGQENRGKRKGSPKIGNCVWIGVNATVVGKITIGDNVLIAPNSYVNCDVPCNSIVFGNPCVIKHSNDAIKGYIENIV